MGNNMDGSPQASREAEVNVPVKDQSNVTLTSTEKLTSSLEGLTLTSESQRDCRYVYKMNHTRRGKLIIINNKTFDTALKLPKRNGSDVDAGNLLVLFRKLGFDVVMKHDQTVSMMRQALIEVGREDHTNVDCFAMAILSHGEAGGVFGTDNFIKIDKLVEPLKGNACKSLLGKPKLFFIQACRGNEFDEGADLPYEVSDDAGEGQDKQIKTYRIPVEADFLYAYATPPDHYAFRNNVKGSWFIQGIKKVFEEHAATLEIHQMMIRVNHVVAYDFQSSSKQKEVCSKKQIPSFVSMLTKELYFTAN